MQVDIACGRPMSVQGTAMIPARTADSDIPFREESNYAANWIHSLRAPPGKHD